MIIKKYESFGDFHTSVGDKSIDFSKSYTINGLLTPGRYETSDPDEQKAIERSSFFGSRVVLVSKQIVSEPIIVEPKIDNKSNESSEEQTKSEFVVEEVTTEEEAANYFIERFNVEESDVSSMTKIRNRMKKYGVEFPNLKK